MLVYVKSKNKNMTVGEVCKMFDVPENVLRWRLDKGFIGSTLLCKPKALYEYHGEFLTPDMLSDISGIPTDALRKRYSKGVRGRNLVAPIEQNPIKNNVNQALECRNELKALIKHHRGKAIDILKGVNLVEPEVSEAVARLNAKALEDAAAGNIAECAA